MFIITTPDGPIDLDDPATRQERYNRMMAAQPQHATITFPADLDAAGLDYWYNRAQQISDEFCDGLPVTFAPEASK